MRSRRSPLTRTIATAAAVAVAAALAAACGDDDGDDGGAAATTPAAKPTPFVIEAGAAGKRKLTLDFPATVKAGLVEITLRNVDSRPRSAQILRLGGDHTVDDALEVVNAEEDGGKIPDWMQVGGGVSTVAPGKSATALQVLPPGRYAIWDDEGGEDGPGNDELGAKGEFTVTGPAADATLPPVPARITAVDDGEHDAGGGAAADEHDDEDKHGFEFAGLKAGRNEVRWENESEELHHALMLPMREGVTIEQVLEALKSEEEPKGPPPVDFSKAVGTVVIDEGVAQNITLDLEPGRYAVVCFISDRDGGKPHAAEGMIEELTIE